MTVSIYTAPAAAGKTAYCIDLARQTAAGLQHEVRVVVPTRQQATAWRRRLAEAGGAIGVHVMTYDELVTVCLDRAGVTYTEVFQPVQQQLLRILIESAELEHYDALREKAGFVSIIRTLIQELKAGQIDPEAFHKAGVHMGNEPRLMELAGLYSAYQYLLQERDEADRAGLGWLAVEALTETAPAACCQWHLLIVDGFDDFTSIQLALLHTLATRIDHMIVTLPQAEQVDFTRYATTRRAVEQAVGQTAVPLPATPPAAANLALAHLSRTLFARAGQAAPPAPTATDPRVTLVEAPDPAAEVRAALRWLKQQLIEQGVSPADVALLARDLTPYQPFIRQIAAEFGMPVHLVDGVPLAQNPAVDALMELLLLHVPDDSGQAALPRREVVAIWRSPYFNWGDQTPLIGPGDADRLDFLARQFRVIRGNAQWQAAFRAAEVAWARERSDEEETGEDDSFLLTPAPAVAATLRQMFDTFVALTGPPAETSTMKEYVRWLEQLMGPDPLAGPEEADWLSLNLVSQARQTAATATADVAALRQLKEVLRGMVAAEEAFQPAEPVSYKRFFRELLAAVQSAHVIEQPPANQPTIPAANVIYARGLSFDAVAILGLGEGSFPATLSEDPFLRDADRELLITSASFPLQPSTLSSERELFYDGVTRARSALLLTRSMLADNGADWVASPYWDEVKRLLGSTVQTLAAEHMPAPAAAASWAELWQCATRQPTITRHANEGQPGIWPQIENAARIWQARPRKDPSPWDGDIQAEAADLAAAYGPNYVWSPSRLEAYQTCPHYFYVGRVLELTPRPDPTEGLDTRQLGHLYHAIFEKVYRHGIPDTDEAGLEAFVRTIADPLLDAAPEEEGFRETPWWSQTKAEIIANVVRSIVELDQESDFRFLQAEAAFGIGGTPPLVLGEGDEQLLMRGLIDRVDRDAEGRVRIIDYKLGGKGAFSKAAFQQGKKLQLPLYALAAEKALKLGPVADGFYWHFTTPEKSGFQLAGQIDDAIPTALEFARDAIREIRRGAFKPEPPDNGCPAYCPAAAFCWHYAPKSW